jgi:TonB family protein
VSENITMSRQSSLNFQWGIAVGLAFLILIFEAIPASQISGLSVKTTDSEMEAIEADLAFDDDVEEQEEQIEEQQDDLQQDTEEMVEEIQTDVTLSLDTETEGLESVETISQGDETADQGEGDEMGPPRFMAAEVFPNCTFRPAATYPEIAAQAGVEGSVVLWVFVASNGSVSDVRLYNSSGVNSLDDAALSAAWNTRWTPAQNNGIPVGVWTTVTYNFSLED